MIPLRWRLTLLYVGLTAVALLGFDLISYRVLADSLQDEVDNTLAERANHVTDAVSVVPNLPIEGISLEVTDEFSSPGVYVQLISTDGSILARSFNLGAQQLPATAISLEHTLRGESFYRTIAISGQPVRLYQRPLRRQGMTLGAVQIGQSLAGVETTLRSLRRIYAVGTAVILLFSLAGSWWIARRGLLPVVHIAQTAHEIAQAEDLARRVDYTGPADEVGTLAATFNQMLARLQTLFESQRRFLAEAAHELRTPLASMLGNVDLLARFGEDPARQQEAVAAARRTGRHAARLLDDLLLLAQAEAGWHLQLQPVAADDIFLDVYETMLPMADGRQLQLLRCDPAQMQADPDRLRQVFTNLIDNACKHSPPDSVVELSLWPENGLVWMRIADNGPGMASESLPHVYDPFFREPGTVRRPGAGLGLTIVHWIVCEHGGEIEIENKPGTGTAVTLAFPEVAP